MYTKKSRSYKKYKSRKQSRKKSRKQSRKQSKSRKYKKSKRSNKKKSKGGKVSLPLGVGLGTIGALGLGAHLYYKNRRGRRVKNCKLNAYKNYRNEYESNNQLVPFNQRYNNCKDYIKSCIGDKGEGGEEFKQLEQMMNDPKSSKSDKQYYIDTLCQNLYKTKSGIKAPGHIPEDLKEMLLS